MTDDFPDFDLYAELEVSERATVETIQAAYRSLQLRNHPDRVGPAAGARAARLNVARDWLTDPQQRARYDAHLAALRPGTSAEDARGTGTRQDGPSAGAGVDAGHRADDEDAARGGRTPRGVGPLHTLRHHLRIDVRRLGRIWLAGLGFIGVLALVPAAVTPLGLRAGIAGAVALVLLGLGLGLGRSSDQITMTGVMARWIGQLLGWVAMGVMALEGVQAVLQLASGAASPSGVAEVAPLALAVTAILSTFAIRRRHGPVETSVDEFLAMTPREFETAVGQILGRQGYRLAVTGGPGDLAADLAGTDPDGRPTVVQCKRYAPGRPVGSRDVQLLIAMGVRHHNAERLLLVTTSDFTDPARDLADEHDVELISGEDLEDLTR
jgi:restriction system protein